QLLDSDNNVVGGTKDAERNVISGNTRFGVLVGLGSGANGANKVTGNYIGADITGAAAIPNGDDGVLINTASTTTVGGTTDAERNLIVFNKGNGVNIKPGSSNKVLGNLISGNSKNGVGTDSGDNNTISGNLIGTNVAGTAAFPNGIDGVQLLESDG